jgi:hypothetical protein
MDKTSVAYLGLAGAGLAVSTQVKWVHVGKGTEVCVGANGWPCNHQLKKDDI